jgi:hemolysin activation/secretion protein
LKGRRPTPWSDLERAVLLTKAIPGADVSIRIHADQSGPGAVEVVATAPKRRKFDLSLGVQHLGGEELGPTAVFARLDANSFTRWGDRTSVVFFTTTSWTSGL